MKLGGAKRQSDRTIKYDHARLVVAFLRRRRS